jgi:lactoylglutathione lyase
MRLLRKKDYPSGRFTLAIVGYGDESENMFVELTYNWDTHQYNFGQRYRPFRNANRGYLQNMR